MKNLLLTFILFITISPTFSQAVAYYDNISFEDSCSYLFLDTTASNIWQIGNPNKIFFDSAYSHPNVIVTDTTNYYPKSNQSFFTLKLPHESFSDCETIITFWHKFNTDTLNDYGVVEVSHDLGNTWNILFTDTTYEVYYSRNGQGSSSNGYATGISSEWNYDFISYFWYLNNYGVPNDIWLRFSFYSDSVQDEKEGWLIDNIEITSYWWSAIKENGFFSSNTYPNPCSNSLKISAHTQKESYLILYIFDMNEEILKKKTNFNKEINLNTSTFKNGMYLYKLINLKDYSTSTGKFIVNK